MALPITGPFNTLVKGPPEGGYPRWARYTSRRKQVKPYNLPLAYKHAFSCVTVPYADGGEGYAGANQWIFVEFDSGHSTWYLPYAVSGNQELTNARVLEAINKARSKFSSRVSERAELLLNLVERKESIEMIAKRSRQLVKFVSALRQFRFHDAAKALGIVKHPKAAQMNLRREAHAFADNFLEYWFGWAPLLSDIGNAVEVLQSPFRSKPVRAGGTASYNYASRVITKTNGYSTYSTDNTVIYDDKARVRMQAQVKVTNPNLWLANQLGFTNPVATAWQAVPFSFVVDYVYNVNQFLSQWTEFHGLELIDPCYSVRLDRTTYVLNKNTQRANGSPAKGFQTYGFTSTHFQRILGIPSVTLRKKGFRLPITRALSSISLLIKLGIKKA